MGQAGVNRAEFLSAGRNFFSLAPHFDFARIAPFSPMGIASCFLLLVRMLRILGGCVKPECGRFSSPILDPLSRQMPLRLRHFFPTFTPQFAGVDIVAAMTPFPFYIGS